MDTRLFRRHPALTISLIVLVSSLLFDLGLTALYRLTKHGTIHYRAIRHSTIRVPSSAFHHSFKPNSASDEEGWGPLHPTLFTNSLGFKDKAIRTVPLVSDHYRILFMGDSFTEGVGYDYPQTFVGLIDEALTPKGVEVLNAGVVGYSPAIYYRKTQYLLNEAGLRFDAMVVCLDISDPIDEVKSFVIRGDETILTPELPSPIRDFFLAYSTIPRYVIKLFDVLRRPADARVSDPIPVTAEDRHYGTNQERSLWTINQKLLDLQGRPGLVRAERHMNQLQMLLSSRQIALVLVIYPWPDQIVNHDLDSIHVRFWREWALAHSVPLVNLFPDFIKDDRQGREVVGELYIEGDTHWNEKGHQLVAHRLLEELAQLLPINR